MIVFLDTSALAKRYVFEAGSAWIHSLCDPSTGHLLFIGQITSVELTSALYRKTRDPGAHFSVSHADGLLAIFGRQLRHRAYHQVRITRAALKHATLLCRLYPLRAYDAIQLASALVVRADALASGAGPVLFVSADATLLSAAASEGLLVDNPLSH